MMVPFWQANTVLQVVLLVISQFSVICLMIGFIILFARKCNLPKLIGFGTVLLFDIILYLLMQLDSRITGVEHGLRPDIPYVVFLIVTLLTIVYGIYIVLSETINRKNLNHTSIKEAFDNLPTGVCFFNEKGIPVLCNLSMVRFSLIVGGRDVQFITDLERLLADDFVPQTDAIKDGKVFVLPNGKAWYLDKNRITLENGKHYTRYIVSDVTDLHQKRVDLQQETDRLRHISEALKALSSNVVAATREEEIINAKMRVHDQMGQCLIESRMYLKNSKEPVSDSIIPLWKRAISMLKYNNDVEDEDMLSQIRETCERLKVEFVMSGNLPEDEKSAYILICSVRECLTNAIRYADADKLYVSFTESANHASVTVTNSGKQPDGPIVEGGGLSTLRQKVERSGGVMTVFSRPEFKLTVTVPKGEVYLL